MAPLVWLVTGTTSGIGAALVTEIAARGDKVVASGRKVQERIGHLKSDNIALLELDITADTPTIKTKIQEAWDIFGHIDVLMNNAGMSAMKSAEESDDEFRLNMFQVNTFGPMRVTQAILPLLRSQGKGTIAFTSSSTAWTQTPFMSHYGASKAALSAYIDSLDKEVAPLGIRCVAFESGAFPTHLGQPREQAQPAPSSGPAGIAAYAPLFNDLMGTFASDMMGHMPGDVAKAAALIVDVVKREGKAQGKAWTTHVALGTDGTEAARQKCREMLQILDDWSEISASTDREGQEHVATKRLFKFTTIL
ncbi:related to ketoreductases [Cephalotrichum gorgonifer]|uniref:Related to ketoreductases n=1 Tax=Cephalotrichum gorgonifer TaxID=2041049 RepID=A0AAE8SWB9_9PEZI|nr:related to ketoreductases [Cephalotrichum gorgonifer]